LGLPVDEELDTARGKIRWVKKETDSTFGLDKQRFELLELVKSAVAARP
jgi:hypothetical protein